jgi:hypothetical protein
LAKTRSRRELEQESDEVARRGASGGRSVGPQPRNLAEGALAATWLERRAWLASFDHYLPRRFLNKNVDDTAMQTQVMAAHAAPS